MSRSNDNYGIKRNQLSKEIFDIFIKYGYENTTLSLIVKELNISKGAFYHYFANKEACADAAVSLYAEYCYKKVNGQMINRKLPAEVNLKNLIFSCIELFKENEMKLESINTTTNAVFHQKLMVALVKTLAPLYAKIIEQGIQEKIFEIEHPLETAQMILTLTNFYFDADLFGWETKEMPTKLKAFEDFLTNALKAKPGLLSFLHHLE